MNESSQPQIETDEMDEQAALFEQLTQSLEEATFLRRLAGHFELRDVRHSLTEVAAEVLPELSRMVEAESMGLLPTDFAAAKTPTFEPLWIGCPRSHVIIRDLIRWAEKRPDNQPVVVNRAEVASTPAAGHGVQCLMLVRVASSNHDVGWLIALNRRPSDEFAGVMREEEFGTVESSLMQAAAAMLATHERNVTLFAEKERLLIGVIAAMSGAVDARDPYTHGHSQRVALYARAIAREMKLSPLETEQIYVSGLLHDIGKIGVPDAILQKQGRLTDEEFAVIKLHPETGYQILCKLDELAYALPGVLHHHERYDGKGYPHGLRGEETPLMARVLAVSDSYDAMSSSRPYRQAMPRERALEIIKEHSGTQWDAEVVNAFFSCGREIELAAEEYAAAPHVSIVEVAQNNHAAELAGQIARHANGPADDWSRKLTGA